MLFFQGASVYCFASFNFMAAVTIYSDFGAQENKICHDFRFFFFFPSICHEMMGPDAMISVFECCFKSAFSLSSFTFLKRLFSFSSLSAIRVVLPALSEVDIAPGSLDRSL